MLSQKWAERKRRILIITPSNLRKQWYQELQDKFFLPSRILETKSYNRAKRAGEANPFHGNEIVICSYQFARLKADDLQAIYWNLVVIDEAHRLRNVYKPANVIARTLRDALADKPELLLTAELTFDYSNHPTRISVLDAINGKAGVLTATLLTIEALDQIEDYLIISGVADDGVRLDEEQAQRLLTVSAKVNDASRGGWRPAPTVTPKRTKIVPLIGAFKKVSTKNKKT